MTQHQKFPRSDKYDQTWVIKNEMGPNVLWLTEWLCEAMDLKPGMKVLDLGCGKALSSIFLAREFDVEVWAADLWIEAEENSVRIEAEGLTDRIHTVKANANTLPFDPGMFDAMISIDAFEYFGTTPEFLPTLLPLMKSEAQLGIANAGVLTEIDTLPTEWPEDFINFHTPAWWAALWSGAEGVGVEVADNLPRGRELWQSWNKLVGVEDDVWLTSAAGENLGINRIFGRYHKTRLA